MRLKIYSDGTPNTTFFVDEETNTRLDNVSSFTIHGNVKDKYLTADIEIMVPRFDVVLGEKVLNHKLSDIIFDLDGNMIQLYKDVKLNV